MAMVIYLENPYESLEKKEVELIPKEENVLVCRGIEEDHCEGHLALEYLVKCAYASQRKIASHNIDYGKGFVTSGFPQFEVTVVLER